MDSHQHRSWMYNRFLPSGKGYTDSFLNGVEEFVSFACQQEIFKSDQKIRCPCSECKNQRLFDPEDVKVHLYRKGFKPDYWYWTSHGEKYPTFSATTSTFAQMHNNEHSNKFEAMAHDVAGPKFGFKVNEKLEEEPNMDAQKFYDMLDAAQKPLWSGCENHTELSMAARLLTIKSKGNISQQSFNKTVAFMKETLPSDNLIPKDFYQAKRVISKLGLTSKRIDCCINGCMLFRDKEVRECLFCGEARFVVKSIGRGKTKEIPVKKLIYFPLIPRLKRLYASMSSASHMRWHYENRRESEVLCHPSDGEAWKRFDETYPEFKVEPRNVRLGLYANGFSPFGLSATPYPCWPVIVTPYNLPPELCMTTPYMFLTLIIPGPHNPKEKIDVYLQPLIDELKLLWEGVPTYDISKKENFLMKAALMWTINDFSAYGMLSGWSTVGKFACPYCMEHSKSFSLKHGGKTSWFDCHRQFLPMDHPYRRNKDAFFKNRVERCESPPILSGEDIWQGVCYLPKITETNPCTCPGFGINHNWTKQSIFWELPYWKSNMLRHNLDVMHIEKNVFDNVFNTVMDVNGKTKDNVKARMDLKEYCRRGELHLQEMPNGKHVKPKAKYVLSTEQRQAVFKWVSNLNITDGCAFNLHRCVNIREGKLYGMKSHDCHVFMERLLPIAFAALPDPVWKPLAELSKFFRDLCSSVLRVGDLLLMEQNIIITICKLERMFPPGFFNLMEHLPIHLPYEARVGGPVQYRWMYPFERFLNRLKQMVKNKSYVEGSICEAYLCQETIQFCSYYFESHIQTMRTRVGQNDDGGMDQTIYPKLSIFNHPSRSAGTCKSNYLLDKELAAAHLHVLLNCPEVQPYIGYFEQYLRAAVPNISQADVDGQFASNFPTWFREYVQNSNNLVHSQFLHHLAWGPNRKVHTWPVHFVNGYEFHTEEWSIGKKTMNCGVCVRGDDQMEEDNYYYGIIKEIVELEYPGDPPKRLVLFNCEWFDAVINRGVKVHKQYGLVEVRHNRRYPKYDPFIFAQNAIQVFYAPYPDKLKDKADWWVVIRTKPRHTVDGQYTLEDAYQDFASSVNFIINDETIGTLRDEEGDHDEVEVDLGEDNDEDEEVEEDDTEEEEDSSDFYDDSEDDNDNDDV